MTGFLHLHNFLRWVVLILMLLAILKGLSGWLKSKPFSRKDKKIFTFAVASLHAQAIIGLVLYFFGPWKQLAEQAALSESAERFWKMEHIAMMLVATILATIGSSKMKRAATDKAKYKVGAIYFIIALLLILVSIPWPFYGDVARSLFPGM
jgi:hypothetical protein